MEKIGSRKWKVEMESSLTSCEDATPENALDAIWLKIGQNDQVTLP